MAEWLKVPVLKTDVVMLPWVRILPYLKPNDWHFADVKSAPVVPQSRFLFFLLLSTDNIRDCLYYLCVVEQLGLARQAHALEDIGSNPINAIFVRRLWFITFF